MKKSTIGMNLLSCLVVRGIVSTTVLASSNKENAPTETTQEHLKTLFLGLAKFVKRFIVLKIINRYTISK